MELFGRFCLTEVGPKTRRTRFSDALALFERDIRFLCDD